ncbi:MAG: PITH domain-containing protein [Streptococcaceae bacterium]|nr:PITH domain-containing protein [Streptococcaceae bacterium]
MLLRSQYSSKQPLKLKIFINPATDIDFSNVTDFKPTSEFKLEWDPNCARPYLFRGPAFNSVTHVAIHVSSLLHPNQVELNPPADDPQLATDQIVINYLGILGSYTGSIRIPPSTAYELTPQPGDHQTTEISKQSLGFGL